MVTHTEKGVVLATPLPQGGAVPALLNFGGTPRTRLLKLEMNSLQRAWKCSSEYQHQSTPVPSTMSISLALWRRNMDPLGSRHDQTGGFPQEVSATDT